METYFTSDLHFGHRRMAEQWRPQFGGDVEAMDEAIVSAWNNRVLPGDEVWILGDISFHKKADTDLLIERLNGTKNVVWGNHDHSKRRPDPLLLGWTGDYKEIVLEGQRLVMLHYPMLSWHKVGSGSWHLFGHSHSNLITDPTMAMMDVGVDTREDFAPWSFNEITVRLQGRTGTPNDHHQWKGAE
jgi:calcineurin-like phosphoesterase family protein